MKTVFMFPGQGAQAAGMGRDLADSLPEVKSLYRQANAIVGYDLAQLCFEGPAEKLDSTEFSQPAIFTTSAACLMALRLGKIPGMAGDVSPDHCAGLSLGEYTALYASGVISFAEGLKLVQLRGKSMQEAADASFGSMVSILSLDEVGVQKLIDAVLAEGFAEAGGAKPLLVAVNFNCPGQIVVSGSLKACERAAARAEEFGASKAIPLRVAGAFHTAMMAPAAAKLGQALGQCQFGTFSCPVISNVDARPYGGVGEIKDRLLRQLVSPVRWQQCVEALMSQGAQRFVEIGPGRVLTGLVKKIGRSAKANVEITTVNGLSTT